MMDNLNLKPKSPDEVKTMMWTGENQREMFDLLTCGKKIDDYMTASGENFFIDHSTVKGGLVLITNVGNQCGCEIPVKIGDYVCSTADMEINGAFPLRTVRLLRTILVELSKREMGNKNR